LQTQKETLLSMAARDNSNVPTRCTLGIATTHAAAMLLHPSGLLLVAAAASFAAAQ